MAKRIASPAAAPEGPKRACVRSPAPPPSPAPPAPPMVVTPEVEAARARGVWPSVATATARFFRERAEQQTLRQMLRRRIEVTADPHYLQRAAGGGARDTWGVDEQCEGDRRFLLVQQLLDSLHQERSELQKMWHFHMLVACLPHIYRTDWPRACTRVLRSLGQSELRSEVMIMTPRRMGKTTAVSMLVTALLLAVPGIKISVISTGGRASGKLKELVLGFLQELGEDVTRRIVGNQGEKLYLAAEPLPPGLTTSSALAHARRTLVSTSFMEVLPNNPDGAWACECVRADGRQPDRGGTHTPTWTATTDSGKCMRARGLRNPASRGGREMCPQLRHGHGEVDLYSLRRRRHDLQLRRCQGGRARVAPDVENGVLLIVHDLTYSVAYAVCSRQSHPRHLGDEQGVVQNATDLL